MRDLVYRLRNPIGQSGSDFNSVYWVGITKEAADRLEKLETTFGELMKAWEFWQSQETKNGFSELCAAYWDAKAALAGEKKNER